LIGCWKPQACHDKRVRQALDYAIDKELIRDTLYGPEVFQVKGWVGVTPSSMGYVPELDPRPYDPDKARALLADAGYPDGKGFPKLIVNTWIASTPFVVEAAQLAADFWKRELGLDVEVRVGDEGGIKKAQYGRQIDGQIMWRDNETKIDISGTLISQFGRPDSKNRFHEDPELYRAVDEAVQILDAEERTEALTKLLLRLKDESYWLSVGYVNLPWGVGPRVEDWRPYPVTDYPSALHTVRLK
jgi:ABC-type transport system substrate-binding protein